MPPMQSIRIQIVANKVPNKKTAIYYMMVFIALTVS